MPEIATRQMMAFLIALTATLSALFIGEILGQMPCTLCWYQRIAMFPLVVVLGVALWSNDPRGRLYALPLALVGFGIAVWHSGLYTGLIPEPLAPCTANGPSCTDRAAQSILGLPIPFLSLAAFAAISLLLLPKARSV
ncbi:disulfide bond formation protein B [Pseudogemmobacter bohemicus]|uniref:disulfide bond formation protein B n=1 Tax=Pseudogemmobacter bohemicus TaxID=2250708 RepID=UPI000DD2F8A2|nr:disulfide bond formation protein B [Pseudogemmobacter bohemicus]